MTAAFKVVVGKCNNIHIVNDLHLRQIPYRERRDPEVGPKHVVEMWKGAPGDIVSANTSCYNQQSLVLKLHNRLFLIRASFYPET